MRPHRSLNDPTNVNEILDRDYEVLGAGNGMLMVSASGTAVVVE
jgi:hypothetical protein